MEETIGRQTARELADCMQQTGFVDPAQQSRQIRNYCLELKKQMDELERAKEEKCKVYKAVGMLTGVLCVIILW